MSILGISEVASLVQTVLSRVWPDKSEQLKAQFDLAKQESQQDFNLANSQIEVNKVEAASSSVFVSGARPYLMWVCGAAFSWQFVLQPLISYFIVVLGHPLPPLPALDSEALNTVLFGLLGLGTMRSFEKIRGVTK